MKLSLKRAATFGAAVVVAATGLVAGATASNAATIGGLILPASGLGGDLFNVKTAAACPAGATNFKAVITKTGGTGAWATGLSLVTNTQISVIGDLVNTGVPISNSIDSLAATAGVQFNAGSYLVQGFCQNALGTNVLGTYDSTVTVTGAAASGNAFTAVPAGAPASTTTLTVAPASPVNLGASVTLTATVASSGTVSGTVDFFAGTTKLTTTPVTVTGGVATFTTTALPGGALSLTAVFTPAAGANVAASTSAAVPFTVNAPAQSTTTTLTATGGTTADPVVLTATVAPAAATGSVDFFEGPTKVGTSPVVNGVATLSLTGVSAAAHSYTATFVSSNTASFLGSTSGTASVTVTAFAGYNLNGVPGGGENITVTIGGGTLTLTAATTTVDLGTATIDTTKNLFVTAPKAMNPVTVVDTRAGNLGYTVSGIAGDFTAGSNKINSENLGWTPSVTTVPAGMSVTAGAPVAPGNGVAAGATSTPVQGLKASRTLGTAAAGGSIGQVAFDASLVLQAPLNTPAGAYSTTLVITAI